MYVFVAAAHGLAVSDEAVVQASEGRWPRICARSMFQRRAGETGWCGDVL